MQPYGWIADSDRGIKRLLKRLLRRIMRWLLLPMYDEVAHQTLLIETNRKMLTNQLSAVQRESTIRLDRHKDAIWRQEERMNGIDSSQEQQVNLLRQINERLNHHDLRMDGHKATIEHLMKRVDSLDRQSDDMSASVAKAIIAYTGETRSEKLTIESNPDASLTSKEDDNVYTVLDYFKFENHFRGTRSIIKNRQKIYIPYFQNRGAPILDIGCGRGEFLELLKQNNIPSFGIDLYPEYVIEGQLHGVDIRSADGIAYLNQTEEKFGGIYIGQVVEHITFRQIQQLCADAFMKLEPESYLIIETPNPMCLSIYTNSFYIDPSHNKPVHPLTLQYLLQEIGFVDVEIKFLHHDEKIASQQPLPLIQSDEIKNLDQVNEAITRVSNMLFGSLDYAVTAKKPKGK